MSNPVRARRPRQIVPASPPPAWSSVAVGALFLAVYLAWTPSVSGDRDGSEFTAVLATLGLAHPTGYPLYTLLGHAFVLALHALGASWAWAANAWSALGGAVAMGLWHAFGSRALARQGVSPMRAAAIALLPAMAFGLNPAWTVETTLAEVNSWHLAWVAAACLFALTTLDDLPAHPQERWRMGRCATWGALVGLGISHHATSVWFALPLSIALIAAFRPLRASWVLFATAAALLPLTSWGYVLYRSTHPAAVQWVSLGPGVHETWNHVTAAGYRHYLGGFAPTADERAALASNVYPWLVPGMIAVVLWPFAPGAPPRSIRWALAAAAALQLGYVFSYGVSDPSAYFLPPLALGLFVLPVVASTRIEVRRAGWAVASIGAMGVVVAAWFWTGAALKRRAMFEELDSFLHTMWMSVPIRRGYVIWNDDMSYRLIQYQQLNHERPELVVVAPRPLMDLGARRLFARRHGFDPLAGAPPPPDAEADTPARIQEFAETIGDGINRSTPDSVIEFVPQQGVLKLLPKPAGAAPVR